MYFYPTLSDELTEAAGIVQEAYNFSFITDGLERKLQAKGKNTVRIEDEDWKIERDGLVIRKKVSIEYPEMLYGENGLASRSAELGLCIVWINRSLKHMGTILPSNEYSDGKIRNYVFDHQFAPGEIKGDLELDLQMYVKRAAENVEPEEQHLINDEGVNVGILDETYLDFGSSFMDFPIQEICNKKQPMWWLEMGEWTDPTTDLFNEDNLCLYLNTAYDGCPKLGDGIKNVDSLIDIITTAFVIIYKRIEEIGYLPRTLNDVNLEQGSISKIMFYFKDSCVVDVDFSSTERMHSTIWMNVFAMLTGGDEQ